MTISSIASLNAAVIALSTLAGVRQPDKEAKSAALLSAVVLSRQAKRSLVNVQCAWDHRLLHQSKTVCSQLQYVYSVIAQHSNVSLNLFQDIRDTFCTGFAVIFYVWR